jgi:hypothetical protein
MTRPKAVLVAFLFAAANCFAEEATLSGDAVMRGDRVLALIKAGTVVEVLSRDGATVTIRHHGLVGAVPASCVPAGAPAASREGAPVPDVPASMLVTPAIVLGPQTLFLANSPEESPDGLREYIPDQESLERWAHMASTRILRGQGDPQAFLAGVQADAVKANPDARTHLWTDNGESVLEATTRGDLPNRIHFTQWGLTRAQTFEGQDLKVYQYAVRYFSVGDSTAGAMDAERAAMLVPFAASSSFEEITNILKPHNLRILLKTEATVTSPFPAESFTYSPRVSLDFVGNLPEGIDIPTLTSQTGQVACGASTRYMLFDSAGVGISAVPTMDPVVGKFEHATFKGRGVFRLHTNEMFLPHFVVHSGGTYTLEADCYLIDMHNEKYAVSGRQQVTIVDSGAPAR